MDMLDKDSKGSIIRFFLNKHNIYYSGYQQIQRVREDSPVWTNLNTKQVYVSIAPYGDTR